MVQLKIIAWAVTCDSERDLARLLMVCHTGRQYIVDDLHTALRFGITMRFQSFRRGRSKCTCPSERKGVQHIRIKLDECDDDLQVR